MSDNMNDKNENLDETVVDETAETASNETVDDVATDDIAADASSADSMNPSILRWYTTMTMQISKLPQLTARKFPTM